MNAEHQAHALAIVTEMSNRTLSKYEAGAREHGGNLWEKPRIIDMALDEVTDLGVYLITLKSQIEELVQALDEQGVTENYPVIADLAHKLR